MLSKWLLQGTAVLLLLPVAGFSQQEKAPETGPTTKEQPQASEKKEHRDQIIQSARTFEQAYNEANAEKVAAHFAMEGEFVDEQGNRFKGRERIKEEFARFFSENKGATLAISVGPVRFITDKIAVEEGYSTVTIGEEAPQLTRYTAVHLEREGKWLIGSVTDYEATFSDEENPLESLAWMIGDWVDEGRDSLITTSCKWSENKQYLLRRFSVRIEGSAVLDGVQRIGWDPLTRKIKSWVFDTAGGNSEGYWTRNGDGWIIKTQGVRKDGTIGFATAAITPISNDSFSWQVYDRIVGDEILPDIDVVIVRAPPKPTADPVTKKD